MTEQQSVWGNQAGRGGMRGNQVGRGVIRPVGRAVGDDLAGMGGNWG